MSARSRERSKEAAKYLKEHGVTRNTGMCPWGCGVSIPNSANGGPLLSHLNRCQGNKRKDGRVRNQGNR